MTEQERINENLQRQIDAQNARIDNVMMKVDIFIAESQQQREDMRRLWERQDALQAKNEADMKAAQEKTDANIKALDEKIDAISKDFTKQLHSNFVQTMIGVGAMMSVTGSFIVAALK